MSAALEFLAGADPTEWPAGLQADCLRALAVAESRATAVHARVLAAFCVPGGGLNGDGHRSARVWLSWQTQSTARSAAVKVGWKNRLAGHPVLAAALAAGTISVSWAAQFAAWTDDLPCDVRDQADADFLTGAGRGADLGTLAQLAEDLRRRHAGPGDDGEKEFADRAVRLAQTFGGAGRLEGDLTGRCAAAVSAVLDSLGGPGGPEDTRTIVQRRHDALEEACTRLIAAGMLPQRAGQPVRLELDITLKDLAENTGGLGCDALIQPVITGHASYERLEQLLTDDDYRARLAARCAGTENDARYGILLELVTAVLSGPHGHAAALRRNLAGGPAVRVACRWTSPACSTPSPCTCAARSAKETSTAGSRAATSPSPPATSTTSSTAKTAAGTPSPTSCSCAGSTTSSPSTAGAGGSPCTPTAPPPPSAPTGPRPCTATHPPSGMSNPPEQNAAV